MSNGVNKAIIIGNCTKDPEVRHTQSGKAVANLSIATNETWRDKTTGEQHEKAEYHRVVLFDRMAEVAGEYLRKGSQVYIEGKIQTRKWQDRDGNDRYTTEIVGRDLQMLGGKTKEETPPASAPAEAGGDNEPQMFDDDIPF